MPRKTAYGRAEEQITYTIACGYITLSLLLTFLQTACVFPNRKPDSPLFYCY